MSDINQLPCWLPGCLAGWWRRDGVKRHMLSRESLLVSGTRTGTYSLPCTRVLASICAVSAVVWASAQTVRISQIKWTHTHTHTHTHTYSDVSVCSPALPSPDWFRHKIVLSSHPLKLWSHRYVCSNCSVWHWIIHLLLFLSHSPRSHSSFYTVSFLSTSSWAPLPPSPVLPLRLMRLLHFSTSQCSLCLHLLLLLLFLLPSFLLSLFFLSATSPPHSLSLLSLPLSLSLSLSLALQYCQPWGESQPSLLFIY